MEYIRNLKIESKEKWISESNILEIGEWPLVNMTSRHKSRVPTIRELEIEHITKTLELAGWRVRGRNGAANILGIKPTTLEARIKKLSRKKKLELIFPKPNLETSDKFKVV